MIWRDEALPRAGGTLLPYGMGRSYGDSCLNRDGTLIDARGLDRFMVFDRERGILRCEAGVRFGDILRLIVPHGWFLPVTPGTQHVTLGGAIANDVHGKNHHRAGTLGRHVRCFELLRSDGTRRLCSPAQNSDWFAATVGGLGLTGLIVWAELELMRVPGPAMLVETIRFSSFDEFLELSHRSHDRFEYVVAWIDCLNGGRNGPRGLFFRANHADTSDPVREPRPLPGVPLTPPVSLLPARMMRLFNAAVWHRPRQRRAYTHYQPFFYPLDRVPHWNRLFGRRGFFQYQCVIPFRCARDALGEMLGRVARARQGSFLAVLKMFGDQPSPGWLSFARPGITLALDFPDRGGRTRSLLDSLDDITLAAGGAVYPAKDARMGTEIFRAGYPRWGRLERYRDPAFLSDFWRRTALGTAVPEPARPGAQRLHAETAG
jgi:FAD/FMN-containing dehydrogenase